jgi:hypothetical protein
MNSRQHIHSWRLLPLIENIHCSIYFCNRLLLHNRHTPKYDGESILFDRLHNYKKKSFMFSLKYFHIFAACLWDSLINNK